MRYDAVYAYRFLTNNTLSDTIPSWISDSNQKLLVFHAFLVYILFTLAKIVIELIHLILMSNSTILYFQPRKFSSNAMTISVAVMCLTTTLQVQTVALGSQLYKNGVTVALGFSQVLKMPLI